MVGPGQLLEILAKWSPQFLYSCAEIYLLWFVFQTLPSSNSPLFLEVLVYTHTVSLAA